jgi:hypothetical protein
MATDIINIMASFTAPLEIGTNPAALIWMFPLLASVAIIYKATRVKVIFPLKFIREVVVLFATMSILMILAGLALYLLVAILTS